MELIGIAILSAAPDEGKSTVAVNLGHSFAKSGLPTLLVDVDVRKADATRRDRDSDPDGGLISLLRRDAAEEIFEAETDAVSGLGFLPLGEIGDVAEASELICGSAMRRLLARLRRRYRVVILDSPPLLPFVDARDLLDNADAGVFVVEWNRTDPESASAALDAIGPSVRKIAGIVMNKVDLRAEPFDGYGYSGRAAV